MLVGDEWYRAGAVYEDDSGTWAETVDSSYDGDEGRGGSGASSAVDSVYVGEE